MSETKAMVLVLGFDFPLSAGFFERGWREEILPMPEIEASFLHPFSYAPLKEEGHTCGELLGWSPTPPANPFSKPLIVSHEKWL